MLEVLRYFVMFGDILMALITFWFICGVSKDDKVTIIGFGVLLFLLMASAGLIWR